MSQDEREFEERADYIDEEDLARWDVEAEIFKDIQSKLRGRGAKLLVAPRGSGKTHQMRLAFRHCIEQKSAPLPVYVSFSSYVHLEPLLRGSTVALKVFHTWVLAKILLEAHRTAQLLEISGPGGDFTRDRLETFVARAEKEPLEQTSDPLISLLTIRAAVISIEQMMAAAKRQRAVLLLDDAALSLTPEYMIEFFDVFRSLKTPTIAPKASVYPGTTEYGPRFHVGHDAEKVHAWFGVQDPGYEDIMKRVLTNRVDPSQLALIPEAIRSLLAYASFGIPRRLIALSRDFIQSRQKQLQSRLNAVLEEHAGLISGEYLSLAKKMPTYKTIIQTGQHLFEQLVDELKVENRRLPETEKQILAGLDAAPHARIGRMLQLLLEAGLLYELPSVKHGGNREYSRVIPHLLFLIQGRAFESGRGFSAERVLERLRAENRKHPLRRSYSSLLGEAAVGRISLDLPACQKCREPRINEDQRFCHKCGMKLVENSVYEACMQIGIDDWPIPVSQKRRIKTAIPSVTTIGDILSLSDPSTELQKTPWIGEVRAGEILDKLQKFVREFLER